MLPQTNKRSIEKIRAAAQIIGEHPEAIAITYDHLAEPVQLAISILKVLQTAEYLTAPEIAEELPVVPETIRQALRALIWNPEEGGIIIQINYGNSEASGYSLPGGKIIWKKPALKI